MKNNIKLLILFLLLGFSAVSQSNAKFENINGLSTSYMVPGADIHSAFIEGKVAIDISGKVDRDGAIELSTVLSTLSVRFSGGSGQILPHQIKPLRYAANIHYVLVTRYGSTKNHRMSTGENFSGEVRVKTTIGLYEWYGKAKKEIGSDKSAAELASYLQLNLKITKIEVRYRGASQRIIREFIENSLGENSSNSNTSSSGNYGQSGAFSGAASSTNSSSQSGSTSGSNNTGVNGTTYGNSSQNTQAKQSKTNFQKTEESIQNHNDWVRKNNEAAAKRASEAKKERLYNSNQTTASKTVQSKTLEQRNAEFEEQSRKAVAAEEQKLAKKRATMKRLEYHNRDNIGIVANHINNVIATKIDISSINRASSPQEVINNLRSIKRQVAQKKEDISTSYVQTMNYINSNTATTSQEANSNLVAAGIATGVAIGATIKANNDQKKAEAAAKQKLSNMYWQLYRAYESAQKNALEQAVYTKDADTEKYSLDQYFYYKCVKADMEKRFSYSNAYWTSPRDCDEPSYSDSRSSEPSLLDVAKRKMQLFVDYKYDLFKKVALDYAQMSINQNKNKSDALIFKAQYTDDITERYSAILYAKSLKKRNFKHGELLVNTKSEFDKAFYSAIDNQNIVFLKKALEISLYPSVNENGETPLMYAAYTDKDVAMTLLLEYSTKVTKTRKKQLLQIACKENSPKVLALLIDEGVVFKRKSYYKNSVPIELAFYTDSKEAFTVLVKNGANYKKIKRKIKDKESYNFQMAKLLTIASIKLDSMPLIEEADKYAVLDDVLYFDQILSSLSSENNHTNNILASRIKDKWMTDNSGKSLVHHAIINDNYDFLVHLLDDGYANRIEDNAGFYPIHYVLSLPPSSRILQNIGELKLNMDVNTKSNIPFLHLAYYNTNVDYYSLFNNPTVDVNTKGLYGWTALHYAARRGDVKSVRYLLEKGADITIEDEWGRTAFFIAKERVGGQFMNIGASNKDYAKIRKMLKPMHKMTLLETLRVYW